MVEFNVSEQRISERALFLSRIANDLLESGVLPEPYLVLREARIPLATNGYFLLNHAYKQWRIADGHNTELPKVAALTAVTMMRFQPFKLLREAQTIAEARCNEIYALTCALSILKRKLDTDSPEKMDFWLRLLDIVGEANIDTIEPYVVDIELNCARPLREYTLVVHKDDRLIINSLITIFELISAKGEKLLSSAASG